jgi:hypothetical protein
MLSKAAYDTLECPRCGKSTKPARVNNSTSSVRYVSDCRDGVIYDWTINRAGEIVNETQTLISK